MYQLQLKDPLGKLYTVARKDKIYLATLSTCELINNYLQGFSFSIDQKIINLENGITSFKYKLFYPKDVKIEQRINYYKIAPTFGKSTHDYFLKLIIYNDKKRVLTSDLKEKFPYLR